MKHSKKGGKHIFVVTFTILMSLAALQTDAADSTGANSRSCIVSITRRMHPSMEMNCKGLCAIQICHFNDLFMSSKDLFLFSGNCKDLDNFITHYPLPKHNPAP